MNELYALFNLNPTAVYQETQKVKIIKANSFMYVIKLIEPKEENHYEILKRSNYSYLKPLDIKRYNNNTYYLFPYLKETKVDDGTCLLKELDILHNKTKRKYDSSKIASFKFKKMVIVMNEKFNSLEMKIREIELSSIKNDVSWIVLSKYYIILEAKLIIYQLIKKVEKEINNLEYDSCFLHAHPTLEHFKCEKFLSFSHAKEGYYVSDLYKVYLELESENKNIKLQLDKVLITAFSKRYFKLMVLFSYTLNLDNIDFNKNLQPYIIYTNKIAKALSLFKEYK